MNFNFRPIVFEDWEILLKWRNDPVVRMNSHNSDLIEEEMHRVETAQDENWIGKLNTFTQVIREQVESKVTVKDE